MKKAMAISLTILLTGCAGSFDPFRANSADPECQRQLGAALTERNYALQQLQTIQQNLQASQKKQVESEKK